MARDPGPLTEVEENLFRNLLARVRNEQPGRFIELFFLSVLAPIESEEAMVVLRHLDEEEKPDAVVVIFKGPKPAAWADASVVELKRKMEAGEC